jgi:hypothetical protein
LLLGRSKLRRWQWVYSLTTLLNLATLALDHIELFLYLHTLIGQLLDGFLRGDPLLPPLLLNPMLAVDRHDGQTNGEHNT